MAIDRDKPANSDFLLSAAIRANWQAMDQSLGGVNLLADPTPLIWPAGDAADPAHWVSSGTGVAIARETSITKIGAMNSKLTYGSATAFYTQEILPSGDYDDGFDSEFFAAGAWLYSDSSDARIGIQDGGGSPTYSDAHPGDSAWHWLTMVHQISASATNIDFRLKVNSAGFAIPSLPTVLYGLVPPQRPVFPAVLKSQFGTIFPGDPVDIGTDLWRYTDTRPFIVDFVQIECISDAASQALIVDVNHTGAGGSMFGGTKVQVLHSPADSRGGLAPDGDYRNRCFNQANDTTDTNAELSVDIDQAPTSGGKNPLVLFSARAFSRPQEILLSATSYQ